MLVLGTLGAPERRRLRGRRGRAVEEAPPEPVPTARATVIRARPFDSREEADAWLAGIRGDRQRAESELDSAARVLSRALHAHRVAAADPHLPEGSPRHALVTRIGFGAGEVVAEGRFEAAWELPRSSPRTKRSMEAPKERFAAILSGRERVLACEALVLRARADLDAGRPREAALQARVALEALLAELRPNDGSGRRGELEPDRGVVGQAANSALAGGLSPEATRSLEEALGRMEAALRSRRLGA